jgi:hypothetical protein
MVVAQRQISLPLGVLTARSSIACDARLWRWMMTAATVGLWSSPRNTHERYQRPC